MIATENDSTRTIAPINDNVIVRLDARTEVSAGGIHIPEVSRGAEVWGTVVSHGAKVEDVAVGDRVFIPLHLGTHYRSGGEDTVILREYQILTKLEA